MQEIRNNAIPTNSHFAFQLRIGEDDADSTPHAMALPSLTFRAWYDGKSPDEPAIVVGAMFQLRYEFSSKPKQSQIKVLARHIGELSKIQAWPYFREYIQTQLTRMGLPAVLLPLMPIPMPETSKSKKAKRHR